LKIAILGASSNYRSTTLNSHSERRVITGNNTGNAVYQDALETLYPEADWILWHHFFAKPKLVDRYDFVLLSLANQIGKHTDMTVFAEALAKTSVPVVAIGLGAQASYGKSDFDVNPGTLAFIHQIQKHRNVANENNLWVRGIQTKETLLGIGVESTAIGCPSLFINPKIDLGHSILQKYKKAHIPKFGIAAGHSSWQVTREIEAFLISKLNNEQDYFLQSDEWLFKLADGESAEGFPENPQRALAKLFHNINIENAGEWLKKHAATFTQIEPWMKKLGDYDFITGGRIHGNILSIQAETMTLAWAIDQRIAELCIQTGVPFISPNQIGDLNEDLFNYLNHLAIPVMRKFDGNRAWQAWSVGNFLNSNGIMVPIPIRNLASERTNYEVCGLSQNIAGKTNELPCNPNFKLEASTPKILTGRVKCKLHPDFPVPLKVFFGDMLVDIIMANVEPNEHGWQFEYKIKKNESASEITFHTIIEEKINFNSVLKGEDE
jgi:hypothetical protein